MLDQIEAHYHKFFGPHRRSRVDLVEKYPCDLLYFDPTPERPYYTIATRGMSAKVMKTPAGMESHARQELLAYIPRMFKLDPENMKEWTTWVASYVYFAARYTLDQNVFMGPGSVGHMEDHRPKVLEKFPYALYILPLAEKSEFFSLNCDGVQVSFSTLMPITQAEVDFLKANGLSKLMTTIAERADPDPMFNPLRLCHISGPSLAQQDADRALRMQALDIVQRDETVQSHYKKFFGEPQKVYELTWKGPGGTITDRLLNILFFPPTAERPLYTLATRGISDAELKLPPAKMEYKRQELLIYLPPDCKFDYTKPATEVHWASRLLILLAFHIFKAGDKTAPLHTIQLQTPIDPDSALEKILIAWPLFETKGFNRLPHEGEQPETIRFSQVIPISMAEAEIAAQTGIDLLRKMEAMGVLNQIADLNRPCLSLLTAPVKPGFRLRPPDFDSPYSPPPAAAPKAQPVIRPQRPRPVQSESDGEMNLDTSSKIGCSVGTALFVVSMAILGSDWYDKHAPKGLMPYILVGSILVFLVVPFISAVLRKRKDG